MTPTSPIAAGSSEGIPAGYGRSCTNCSRAKCRCVLMVTGGSCERCHRLGKECHQISTTRKRVAKKTATSRTAQLEEKIEDLVSMLRAGHHHPRPNQPIQSASIKPPSSSSSPPYPPTQLDSLAAAAIVDPCHPTNTHGSKSVPGPGQGNSNHSSLVPETRSGKINLPLSDLDRRPEPTAHEAEAYLAKFRDWLQAAPFMHIPRELTAEALKKEKPFLWLCIMNLCSMSNPQQRILKERIRQEIAERVVLNHDRTMDMLQGLIAFIAWANMNTTPGMKPFVLLYSSLAQSIAFEMGLTRSPFEEQQSTLYFKMWSTRVPLASKIRTMNERRAILGLWLVISITTGFIGKMETLVWTPHMDECLDVLERENEVPSDAVLVAMVKTQLLGEEVQRLKRDRPANSAKNPAYIFKSGMVSRLHEIRSKLPDRLTKNVHILMHLHSTEALIHSIGVLTDQSMPEALRIKSLYSCAKSAKAFYDAFFALSPIQVAGLPFATYVGMSHIQVTLYRITVFENPAWDKDILRSTVDLLYMLEKTIELFYKTDEAYPIRTDDQDGSLFARGAKTVTNLRNSWAPVLAPFLRDSSLLTPHSQDQVMQAGPHTIDAPAGYVVGDVVADDPTAGFDLTDLVWMSDNFGPWDC